jgi:hypothetical protein
MFVTTFTASIDNIINNYLPKHNFQGNLNVALSVVMLGLVLIIFIESMRKSAAILLPLFAKARQGNLPAQAFEK